MARLDLKCLAISLAGMEFFWRPARSVSFRRRARERARGPADSAGKIFGLVQLAWAESPQLQQIAADCKLHATNPYYYYYYNYYYNNYYNNKYYY